MRVLVSGFEAFGGNDVNPTEMLMRDIAAFPEQYRVAGLTELRATVLPVTFDGAFEKLSRESEDYSPDAVVAFGLAAGRSPAIELERVAINCIDCEIPDNAGRLLRDEPIRPGGENAYFSTLPLRAMLEDLHGARIPARISNTAGTYVCNYLFYRLQESNVATGRRTGFIHVPYLPEQVRENSAVPVMAFEQLRLALRTVLATLVRVGR